MDGGWWMVLSNGVLAPSASCADGMLVSYTRRVVVFIEARRGWRMAPRGEGAGRDEDGDGGLSRSCILLLYATMGIAIGNAIAVCWCCRCKLSKPFLSL